MNTTAHDGAACSLCGEDAVTRKTIGGTDYALCDACDDDQIDCCPACDAYFLLMTGVRMFGTSSLYCCSCASAHPALILGRAQAASADECRDDMNRTRR